MDQLVCPDQLEEPVKRDRLVIVDAAVKTVLQELMELRVLKEHPVYLQSTEGDCCTLHSLQVRCIYNETPCKADTLPRALGMKFLSLLDSRLL